MKSRPRYSWRSHTNTPTPHPHTHTPQDTTQTPPHTPPQKPEQTNNKPKHFANMARSYDVRTIADGLADSIRGNIVKHTELDVKDNKNSLNST